MALSNAYFGSTLTDAQRAATMAAQQELEADAQRKNYLNQIMQALVQRQRMGQQERQFGQELGFRNQELQTNAMLRALALSNQQREMDQNAWLQRDALGNALDIARVQYPKERWMVDGDRAAAERIRQQSIFDQNNALLDDEIDQHNTSAEAVAARYNAMLKALTDEKDGYFTFRSTAQSAAWRELLEAIKTGGDDKLIKPEANVDAATKEIQYKFVPLLRKRRTQARGGAGASTATDSAAIIAEAKRAIAAGADPAAVANRLSSKFNLSLNNTPYSEESVQPLVDALRGRMQLGAGVYPPPVDYGAITNQPQPSVRAQTLPIPGTAPAFQQGPSMVDLINALNSYAGR